MQTTQQVLGDLAAGLHSLFDRRHRAFDVGDLAQPFVLGPSVADGGLNVVCQPPWRVFPSRLATPKPPLQFALAGRSDGARTPSSPRGDRQAPPAGVHSLASSSAAPAMAAPCCRTRRHGLVVKLVQILQQRLECGAVNRTLAVLPRCPSHPLEVRPGAGWGQVEVRSTTPAPTPVVRGTASTARSRHPLRARRESAVRREPLIFWCR